MGLIERGSGMTYPELCPECKCPIQLLSAGKNGETTGTIHDAMEAHYLVVHKDEPDVTE